jgi:hypothetical protein
VSHLPGQQKQKADESNKINGLHDFLVVMGRIELPTYGL